MWPHAQFEGEPEGVCDPLERAERQVRPTRLDPRQRRLCDPDASRQLGLGQPGLLAGVTDGDTGIESGTELGPMSKRSSDSPSPSGRA